jgi:hypothetical protein
MPTWTVGGREKGKANARDIDRQITNINISIDAVQCAVRCSIQRVPSLNASDQYEGFHSIFLLVCMLASGREVSNIIISLLVSLLRIIRGLISGTSR